MGVSLSAWNRVVIPALLAVMLAACASPNDVAMEVGAPPELEETGGSTVALRVLQTRRFDTLDERRMLASATQTLQDLGFTVTESSLDAGVLVGSKQRDAEETGQVAGQIILTLMLAAMGTYHDPQWDKQQDIVATIVTNPIANSDQLEVRVSFDRRITNNKGILWRTEIILEAEIYQEFFKKLGQAAFLEAHEV